MQVNRLAAGGRVDRAKQLNFFFNGKLYKGLQGDSLASALLADGVDVVGRSFKYGRPRGIVGHGAEESIHLFALAMKHGLGLNKILGTIHTYPTLAEANKYVAGEWKRAHAPERLLKWVGRFHAWRRGD